jgi:hypothetical protein
MRWSMSTSARKGNKRTDTFLELKKAADDLHKAADKLASIADIKAPGEGQRSY